MHSIRPEKAAKVAELKDLMTGSKGVILVDYCGLTVAEDTDLRRKMREAGVTYMVAKNTFVRIAAKEAGIEGLDSFLEHNTALAFSAEDPVAPAKILSEFAKDHKALEIKAGILDGAVIGLDEVKALADLRAAKSCLPNSSAACRPRFLDSSTSFTVRCVTLFTLSTPFVKRKNRNLPNGWFDSAT